MILAGFDLETTGFNEPEHRIVEAHVSLWRLADRKKLFGHTSLVNPERTIPADAQRIHGIGSSDVAGAPTWSAYSPTLHKILSRADVWIGHNGRDFDKPFVNREFVRAGHAALDKPIFDTMQDARWASPIGKAPTLAELCFACGVPYDADEAHSAEYDVDVMMKSFFAALDWGWFTLPEEMKIAA